MKLNQLIYSAILNSNQFRNFGTIQIFKTIWPIIIKEGTARDQSLF